MRISLFFVLAILGAAGAHAQADYTLESLAAVTEQHAAQLDSNSIRQEAGFSRFDVRVTWKDLEQKPADAAALRYVRYLAKCGEGSLALAGVAVHDEAGRMLKNAIVPPGAWEYEKPEAGSREAQWLKQICR